ncbi:MAG: amino acid adenylation domain-containing protein [Desulfobacterales bacterium]|nr:amino acid adenylation domain-containing protein [Desulfobacterales bacterium]
MKKPWRQQPRRLSDGSIRFLGRVDFQVKIRRFRIEPGENTLAPRGCEGVKEAVVVAREEPAGKKRLTAWLTGNEVENTTGSVEPRTFLKTSLPDHMIPSFLTTLEAIPLAPSGKVDRDALPGPDPDGAREREFTPLAMGWRRRWRASGRRPRASPRRVSLRYCSPPWLQVNHGRPGRGGTAGAGARDGWC